MATFRARMIDALTPGEAVFDFDARDELMNETPLRVARAFFETIDRNHFAVKHADWEANFALKSPERGVVTCAGVLYVADGAPVPFTVMIGRKG